MAAVFYLKEGCEYIGPEIITKFTYYETYKIGACGSCSDAPERFYTVTIKNFTTYSSLSNGNSTSSHVTNYRDNGPGRCPDVYCYDSEQKQTYSIRGFNRANNYEIKHYTFNHSDGKRTEFKNKLIGGYSWQPVARDYPYKTVPDEIQIDNKKFTYPLIWGDPYNGDGFEATTTTSTAKIRINTSTYTPSRIDILSTEILPDNRTTIRPGISFVEKGIGQGTKWATLTFTGVGNKKIKERIGYRLNGGLLGNPALGCNYYRHLIVSIIDTNEFVWYRKNNSPPNKIGEMSHIDNIYSTLAGVRRSAKVSFKKPYLVNQFIGSYNSKSVDEEYGSKAQEKCDLIITLTVQKQTTTSKTCVLPVTSKFYNKVLYLKEFIKTVYPFVATNFYYFATSFKFPRESATTEAGYYKQGVSERFDTYTVNNQIQKIRTKKTQGFKTVLYEVNISNLKNQFTKKGAEFDYTIPFVPKYSTHGPAYQEDENGLISYQDFVKYQEPEALGWGLIAGYPGPGIVENWGARYLDGVISPASPTRYAKEIFLNNKKTFNVINTLGGYIAGFMIKPNVALPIIAPDLLFITQNQKTIGTVNCFISKSILSKVEHISFSENNNSSTFFTETYSWEVNGKNQGTFLHNYMFGNNANPFSIGNANNMYSFNFADANYRLRNWNYGKNRHDGDGVVTRVLHPGQYLRIADQTQTYQVNEVQYTNAQNDANRALFIPGNFSVLGIKGDMPVFEGGNILDVRSFVNMFTLIRGIGVPGENFYLNFYD